MHQLFWKWCESFTQHCNSHLNRIIIGAAIQDSIILTPRFVEVKKPSQVLASTLNIPYSFSGRLHWKQLEFNSPHPVPPITSMCPLSKSVIWSPGKHSLRGPWRRPAFFRWSIKLDRHLHYSRPWLFRCLSLSLSQFGGGLPLNSILCQNKCDRCRVPFKSLNKMPWLACTDLRNKNLKKTRYRLEATWNLKTKISKCEFLSSTQNIINTSINKRLWYKPWIFSTAKSLPKFSFLTTKPINFNQKNN